MAYDVGKIARELQQAFRLFKPGTTQLIDKRDQTLDLELADNEGGTTNLATPANVKVLLSALDDLTSDLLTARDTMSDVLPDAAIPTWDQRLSQWRGRLGAYHDAVDKAPPGDRADILWGVTAPLLIGFYGGEGSNLPQQPLDAVTPFSLANQLQVADEWRDERLRLFVQDIEEGIESAVAIGGGLLTVVAIAGTAFLGWAFLRRRGR